MDTSSFSIGQIQTATSKVLRFYSGRTLSKLSPIISITVKTHSEVLSLMLARSIIQEAKNLVRSFKLSSLLEKKQFIEIRLNEISNDLQLVEDKLKNFRDKK